MFFAAFSSLSKRCPFLQVHSRSDYTQSELSQSVYSTALFALHLASIQIYMLCVLSGLARIFRTNGKVMLPFFGL
jgi:hypothetical protein